MGQPEVLEGQHDGMEAMQRAWEASLMVWRPVRWPGWPTRGSESQPEGLGGHNEGGRGTENGDSEYPRLVPWAIGLFGAAALKRAHLKTQVDQGMGAADLMPLGNRLRMTS